METGAARRVSGRLSGWACTYEGWKLGTEDELSTIDIGWDCTYEGWKLATD